MERLKRFNEADEVIGDMTRAEAHEKGYWHETFHCWLTATINRESVLLLQLRSATKKAYASLYDITAAGHLLSHETVEDGLREVEEELGLFLCMEAYESIGTLSNVILSQTMKDREWARCFTAEVTKETAFTLQLEEVEKIVYCTVSDFSKLVEGSCDRITIRDWMDDRESSMTMNELVPHPPSYFHAIASYFKSRVE